jgi:hypothetical protein
MIVAADAGRLDEAIGQVRAPVRAMSVEQSELPAQILVEHEILAHQTNGLDRIGVEFAGAADRHPVAAQQLTHRRPRTHLGEKAVFLRTEHASPRCSLVAVA